MQSEDLRTVLLEEVDGAIRRGMGFAQQSVVLHVAAEKLGIRGKKDEEQELLNIWHDLFRSGELVWGLNLDNPGPPWFHRRVRQPQPAS